MQERNSEKCVAIMIKTSKVTAHVLKTAMVTYLNHMKNKSPKVYKGKQPVKKLVRSGAKLENVAVNDNNIKSFERIARKYGIDYSLRKDSSENPPKYYIFFKANDSKVMNAAFSEYTRRSAELEDKPSVREKLKTIGEHGKVKTQERTREKSKTREAEL